MVNSLALLCILTWSDL